MFMVLFDVLPRANSMDRYLELARLLRPELVQVAGFLDNERFAHHAQPGRLLSLSSWADEKALIRWRTHARHHDAQAYGREVVLADYRLRVGEIFADSALPVGQQLREQRLDSTEASATKVITVLELDPEQVRDAPFDDLVEAVRIIPERAPTGWLEGGHYTSITREGKLALLAGWADAGAAQAWHAQSVAPLAGLALRCRFVRVIRSYGIRDRAEAPQYYPEADAAEALIW